MKRIYHTVQHWDVVIIFVITLLSFLPFAIFSYQQSGKLGANSQFVAVISVDNETIKQIPLTGHSGTDIFDITVPNGDIETIEVRDEQIRIKHATCPDQICVKTGFISKPGRTIVCLPHKVLIEIQTIDGQTDDLIISS